MNLHRIQGVADWELISRREQSFMQRIAARSKGFITPGNVTTLIGLIAVLIGLIFIYHHTIWPGFILIISGRFLDILDGVLADKTKTKSPVGEIFDAAADKIETIVTISVLLLSDITRWWVLLGVIVPQLIILGVIYQKRRTGVKIHPTKSGKISMACLWVGIGGLLILKADSTFLPLVVFTYIILILSCGLGMYALWQYANESESATK